MSDINNTTTVRATIMKIDGMFQIHRYFLGGMTKAIGEPHHSFIEAEHAFFRQFPLGILAEGNRHGIQQMPTRGHAREYAKNFPLWKAVDTGHANARWCVVKRTK